MAFELADHEDTFPDANRYAASKINVAERLAACRSKEEAERTLAKCQAWYGELFDAFQAGVKLAREMADDKCPSCGVCGGELHKQGCPVPRLGAIGRAALNEAKQGGDSVASSLLGSGPAI